WQTAFLSVKFIGWGWFYLSTILDDFSRYIIAWKLCTTMRADDVTDTLQMALTASGCCSARVLWRPNQSPFDTFILGIRIWSRNCSQLSLESCTAIIVQPPAEGPAA